MMKKLFYSLIITLTLFVLTALPAMADSTTAALTAAQLAEIVANNDPVGVNAPYSKDDFPSEYIDPLEGSLTLKEDILYLPGKNGLDVKLTAKYNSSQINEGYYLLSTATADYYHKNAYYYSYDNNGTKETVLICPDTEEHLLQVAGDSFYVSSLSSVYDSVDDSGVVFYYLSQLNTGKETILLTREADLEPVLIQMEENTLLESSSLCVKPLHITDMWNWELPVLLDRVHPTLYDSYDGEKSYYQDSVLVDLDGEYCKAYFDYVIKTSTGNIVSSVLSISGEKGTYTGYYTSENIVDEERGITYHFSVTDSQGRTMYFTKKGFLCAVEDRFGNMIKYTFCEQGDYFGYLQQIVDTLGRVITLEYTDSDVAIYVDENGDGTKVLYAEFKNTCTNSSFDTSNHFISDNTYSSRIIRYNNGSADYVKEFEYVKWHQIFYDGSYYKHEPIECELVNTVSQPNRIKSHYNYVRTTHDKDSFDKKIYSVSERYDEDTDNEISNKYTYVYTPGTKTVETRAADGQIATYNITNVINDRVSSKITTCENQIYTETYSYDGPVLNRKVCRTRNQYTDNNVVSTTFDFYTDYDTTYRPNTIAHGDFTQTTTYHDNSMFVKDVTYNRDANTYVKKAYTLSQEGDDYYTGRTIDKMTVSESTDGGETYTDKYVVEYTYNSDGTLASEKVDPDGINQVTNYTYVYGTDGSITTTCTQTNLTDPEGNSLPDITTSSKIDHLGRVLWSKDGNNNTTEYEYDYLNRLTKVTNPDNTTVTYDYDIVNRTTIVTDEDGIMQKVQYDGFGNTLAVYKNAGTNTSPVWVAVYEYEYDSLLRPVTMIEYTLFDGNTPTKWLKTCYTYTAFDNVAQVAVYNESGTELSKDTYTYNFAERIGSTLGSITAHDGTNGGTTRQFTTITVTPTAKDGITPPTVKQYIDRLGRLCKQVRTDGEDEYITTYIYDACDNVLEMKDETAYKEFDVDYTKKLEYNYLNQVVREYNAEGNYIENTYDVLGRQISTSDYMGNTATYTYDSIGRMLTASAPVDDGVSSLSKYYYDANSNLTSEVKSTATGNTQYTYTYDSRNRLVSSFDGGAYTLTEYDGNQVIRTASGIQNPENVEISELSPTDATYNVSLYTYDSLGNLATETHFNGATTYTYDLAGNVLTTTDPNGNTTTNTYDSRRNLLKSNTEDNVIFTYTYNSFGLLTYARRELKTFSQIDSIATGYVYDNFFRNITENLYTLGTINRTYNTAGQVTGMTLTKSDEVLQSVEYTYNVLGNMTSASNGSDTVSYTYNANGLPISEEKDVFITNYAYTSGNLMKSTSHTRRLSTDPTKNGYNIVLDVSSFAYTYFPDGNVATVTDTRGNTTYNTSYAYDGANRLTNASITSGDNFVRSWAYAYNNRGDRTSQVVTDSTGVSTTAYTYTNHRLTSESTDGVATTYTYDANGNMLTKTSGDETTQFTYSSRNELRQIHIGTVKYSYSYNPMSRRVMVSRTENNVRTSTAFIWAGENIIQIFNDDTTTDYFYGINRVSRNITGDAYTYDVVDEYYDSSIDDYVYTTTPVNGYHEFYAYDGRGNVVHTLNTDITDLYIAPHYGSTAPFPEADMDNDGTIGLSDINLANNTYPIVQNYYYSPFGEVWQGEKANDTNSFRYAGELFDKETGNIYLRARYYDPTTGRFTSIDPIRDSTNWYVYCGNNPIKFVDPSGLRNEELEILAEACGGTYTYSADTQCAIIQVGDKTLTYSAPHDASFVQNGKLYIDGETFASDLGATYIEVETDAYEGFIISYATPNYETVGASTLIKANLPGQLYANDYNEENEANVSTAITVLDISLNLLTSGANKYVKLLVYSWTAAGTISNLFNVDFAYDIHINDRILTTYRVDCSSTQASTLYQTNIITADGKVVNIQKNLIQ